VTTAPPQVRPARREDAPALAALDHRTWSPRVTPAPRPPEDRDLFAAGVGPADVLVVEVDGAVAGYVQLGRPTPHPSNRHVVEVAGLAVDPLRRRLGLGRVLVRAAAAEAAGRGARRLTLRVLAPNAEARALYASCGFGVEGVLAGEFLLDGAYVDDVLMALDLAAPAGG
jgi:ribosomal protein S18 acetylase RimI-like enzyme